MEKRYLGKNGPLVSRLCFGTLTMAPMQKNLNPDEGAALILHAYERGVNFLDTADLYDNYEHIRRALVHAPDIVVSTKAYCWDEKTASEALERAFRALNRDYIDIFMLHEQESLYTLRGHEEALNYLYSQIEKGHVGAVGVSTHYSGCVHATSRFDKIQIVHPLINLGGIGIQDGTRDDMEREIIAAKSRGVGIFAMKPLGGGHLISKSYEAIKYLIDAPWADSIAVGMQSRDEVDANIDIFEGKYDIEAIEALRRKERRLIIQDWCEGCGKCAERCGQKALAIVNSRSTVDPEKCVFCGYCARVCPQFCIKVV